MKTTQFDSLNATNSTIFIWNNTELRTTQDPYADGEFYKAHALDALGNEYAIEWTIIDEETTDESEACDWDIPYSVIMISGN